MSTPNPTDSFTELIEALAIEDLEVRRQAIRLLGQQGSKAANALPKLREALEDSDFRIRLEAAVAIGFIGTQNDTTYLLPLLDDEVEAVRFQTISAIAFLQDSQAAPELIRRYDQETIHVQDQILRALGHLGGQDAYRLLERETRTENPIIRTGAVVGLSFLGDPRACTILEEVAATDTDDLVAHEAHIALLQLRTTNTMDVKKDTD